MKLRTHPLMASILRTDFMDMVYYSYLVILRENQVEVMREIWANAWSTVPLPNQEKFNNLRFS